MPRTRSALCVGLLAAALSPIAVAKVSHAGWPKFDGVVTLARNDNDTTIQGTDRSDELAGAHGSDTIDGGPASDVLWGDYKASGQSLTQVDHLTGGSGRDFIYSSHGVNYIDAGTGNDVVHAHYGRGIADCGPGRDLIYLSHKRRRGWKLRHCERITFHSGLGTLTPNG
jgi:Ca2+-binding RTX toxin-like protein